jgi:heat shock protein HtpX
VAATGDDTIACPECAEAIPHHPGYTPWCGTCGWNLAPQQATAPRTRSEALLAGIGRRAGTRMLRDLSAREDLAPRVTADGLTALCLALLVHLLSLACLVGGIALIVLTWLNPFMIVLGVALVGTAWVARPRVPRPPKDGLERQEHPTLYAVADEVAAALGTPSPTIRLSPAFNASYAQVGWRRRPVLTLGMPLWAILEPQERVELVAHELAHGANGDPTRGLVVGSAVNSLLEMSSLLRPHRVHGGSAYMSEGSGLASLAAIPANIVLGSLSRLLRAAATGLAHLVLHEHQRAEFLADVLAAEVGGREAALGTMEKVHLQERYDGLAKRCATAPRESCAAQASVYDLLRAQVEVMPAREWERLRRVAELEESRLGATHPPTAHRLQLLRSRPDAPPRVCSMPSARPRSTTSSRRTSAPSSGSRSTRTETGSTHAEISES